MLHLTVGLKPKNNGPMIRDYSHHLRSFCCNCIGKEPNAPCQFVLSDNPAANGLEENNNLISFSLFQGDHYNVQKNSIRFTDNVFWKVESSSYDKIEKLVQELYRQKSICIEDAEFEIFSIDLH